MLRNKFANKFTQISNAVLNDNELTLEEKGLFCYLFSKPDGWEFHYSVMRKELKEKSDKTVRKVLNSLVEKGYITKKQVNNPNGQFGGIDIEFTDKAFSVTEGKNADASNLPVGKNGDSSNLPPNNTNTINNTDLLINTKDINTLPLAKSETLPIPELLDVNGIKNEIYELFDSLYKEHTGNKYLAKNHEFVNLVKTIKQFSKEIIINKIYLFEAMCENKTVYFTKNGFADFTLGKLISHWNEIVAEKETEGSFVASVFGEE